MSGLFVCCGNDDVKVLFLEQDRATMTQDLKHV